jgi:hypothetical protein
MDSVVAMKKSIVRPADPTQDLDRLRIRVDKLLDQVHKTTGVRPGGLVTGSNKLHDFCITKRPGQFVLPSRRDQLILRRNDHKRIGGD